MLAIANVLKCGSCGCPSETRDDSSVYCRWTKNRKDENELASSKRTTLPQAPAFTTLPQTPAFPEPNNKSAGTNSCAQTSWNLNAGRHDAQHPGWNGGRNNSGEHPSPLAWLMTVFSPSPTGSHAIVISTRADQWPTTSDGHDPQCQV